MIKYFASLKNLALVSRNLPYCLTQNLYFSLGSCKILVKFEFCYGRQRVQLCENPEPKKKKKKKFKFQILPKLNFQFLEKELIIFTSSSSTNDS